MADYVESPVGRVVAVNWGVPPLRVVGRTPIVGQPVTIDGSILFATNPPGRVPSAGEFNRILVGETSGATADFRNVPTTAGVSVSQAATPPVCDELWNNIHTAAGVLITTEAPAGYTKTPVALVISARAPYTLVSPGHPDPDYCQRGTTSNFPDATVGFVFGELVSYQPE